MVNIIKEEIEESLESRLRIICNFCKTIPIIINGCIKRIDKTDLIYIKSHRIYIKNYLYLAFNYSSLDLCQVFRHIFVGKLQCKIIVKNYEFYVNCDTI